MRWTAWARKSPAAFPPRSSRDLFSSSSASFSCFSRCRSSRRRSWTRFRASASSSLALASASSCRAFFSSASRCSRSLRSFASCLLRAFTRSCAWRWTSVTALPSAWASTLPGSSPALSSSSPPRGFMSPRPMPTAAAAKALAAAVAALAFPLASANCISSALISTIFSLRSSSVITFCSLRLSLGTAALRIDGEFSFSFHSDCMALRLATASRMEPLLPPRAGSGSACPRSGGSTPSS
mmetsp:Transcript_81088/g.212894  ORF Transcript_81088/g.212894 Transcript_81088/m.212894 type:complete len:239 (+) Transcript_81088:265-981(+)